MTARSGSNTTTSVAALFAAISVLLAGAALCGLDPANETAARSHATIHLGGACDEAAELEAQTSANNPGRLELARSLSLCALDSGPYDTSAWLRLAYLDQRQHGRLGREGIEALRKSYMLVPYDPYVDFWRIRFSLENWADLPPDLRHRTHDEVFVVASEPGHRLNLRKTLLSVRNPPGLLISMFWVAQIANMGKQ